MVNATTEFDILQSATNSAREEAVEKLIAKMFGNHKNYESIVLHHAAEYERFITEFTCLRTLMGLLGEEHWDQLIAMAHNAAIPYSIHQKRLKEKDGVEGLSSRISVVEFCGRPIDLESLNRGTRAKSTRRNPLLDEVYRSRVSVLQSRLRSHGYSESEVALAAAYYTKEYNKLFGTEFAVYHSAKRTKKN